MSAAPNPGGFGPDVDIPIDTAPRIAELKLMLEDPATCQQQIPNILAVLTEYEAGRTPEFIYQDGDLSASEIWTSISRRGLRFLKL
ncbi:hypothetical protein TWF173_006288 [Orbilia oligospora]|nr:hypothetical protein TWF173_006288 [Orbilia oligospora]